MPIDAARVTRDAPFDGQQDERCPTDGVTRAAGAPDRTAFDMWQDTYEPSDRQASKPLGYYRPINQLALVTTFDRPEIVHPVIDDDSDFEGRETYQDDIEDASMFSVADGDDDAMFVIDMKVKSGCQRCGCTFFARGNCLQCGADDPGKQIMGCE